MESNPVKLLCFSLILISITQIKAEWALMATSSHYINTRLVMETENPFSAQNISKKRAAILSCAISCQLNSTCQAFNFYTMDAHYVCELLAENFCFQRQRIALQIWPGGRVWDKLRPNMTKACINQKFETANTTNYCEIGRSGCRNRNNNSSTVWLGCDTCAKTCNDCFILNNIINRTAHNCTLWPEGPSNSPIFAICLGSATFLVKRRVYLSNGTVWPDYRMTLWDMYRISKLSVYSKISFCFQLNGTSYSPKYKDFFIDDKGTLSNMTYIQQTNLTLADGFNVGNTSSKPSPWIKGNSTCGDFWLLNSTFTTATTQCPGGDVSMFGAVNVQASPKQTGIRWPPITAQNGTADYADIKIDF